MIADNAKSGSALVGCLFYSPDETNPGTMATTLRAVSTWLGGAVGRIKEVNVATSENAWRLLHICMPHLLSFIAIPTLPVLVLFSLADQIGTEKKKSKAGQKKKVGFEEQLLARLAVGPGQLQALESVGEARSTFTDQVGVIKASLQGEKTDQFEHRSKRALELETRRHWLARELELIVLADETLCQMWGNKNRGPSKMAKLKDSRVRAFFKDIATRCGQANVPPPKVAIYTTGGGGKVGILADMLAGGWRAQDKRDDLPTVDAMELQLDKLKALVQAEDAAGPTSSVTFYRSYRYRKKTPAKPRDKGGDYRLMPSDLHVAAQPEMFSGDAWKTEWMKPHTGALEQAMQDAGVSDKSKVLVIGNDDGVDRQWADGCGIRHCYQAKEFFGQFE